MSDYPTDRSQSRDIRRLRVLHVSESYGAGVATAINQYVRATPHIDHLVLRAIRREHHAGEKPSGVSELKSMSSNPLRAIFEIYRLSRKADIVHAHSSYAGFFVRMVPFLGKPVVYTPHCFAFERQDLPKWKKALVHIAEKALSSKTAVVAACSEREAALAASLNNKIPQVFVPNVAAQVPAVTESGRSALPHFVGVGRLSPQKGLEFFAECARQIRARWPEATVMWLGGGDHEHADRLSRAGIVVSGWLSHEDILDALGSTKSLYIHTAEWEGFPMTILEATAMRVPMVVRDIPAFEGYVLGETIKKPAEITDAIERVLADWDGTVQRARDSLRLNTRDVQVERLERAYDLALQVAK